ncbi:MAG: metallophosphoesterase [Tissierellia bacterium]|mgnify:CR=1 FL=1|nr:metallophosphoesterase [Tissierellia bacterium]
MKKIENIYSGFLSIFNYPYIPKELLKRIKGPILLHISDTPIGIYDYIFRIIDIIKPQFIVHTGDLVDNIKLANYTNKIDLYNKGVARLIEGLEKNKQVKIYYTLGNHDNYETVSKLNRKGIILQEGIITIENYKFAINHYYKEHTCDVDFNLYGHSFVPGHYKNNETINLNGVLNINIIDLSTKEIFHLDYPIGTNRLRLMEFRRIHF